MTEARKLACLTTDRIDRVLLVKLDRPKSWNALSEKLIQELSSELTAAERDPKIGAVLLHGTPKAFAAGADLDELSSVAFPQSFVDDIITPWDQIARFRKPLIVCVEGVAFGGGFELAMMADVVVASRSARFGLPEIGLGLIPGGGGTQRLVRASGKAIAMDLILTGEPIEAERAYEIGVVSRLVDDAQAQKVARDLSTRIANAPQVAAMSAKEAVLAAFDTPLNAGVRTERRLLQSLFATSDAQEGISAFQARRAPKFTHS